MRRKVAAALVVVVEVQHRIWSGHRTMESPRDELLCHGGCLLLEGLRRRRDLAAGEVNDRRRRNPPHRDTTSWQGREEEALRMPLRR
jgi:hypothetical protein